MGRPRGLGVGIGALVGALCVVVGSAAPAVAEEPEDKGIVIATFDDIFPKLPPEGARQWDPAPLVEAIGRSEFTFTPNHYYELLDKRVHPEVVKMVCAKAAVFCDPNALPLDEIEARARAGQTPVTKSLTQSNFVELFEFFNDVKNDLDRAEANVGPLAPMGRSESVSVYERRARTRLERLAKARGPAEGRVEATTFQLSLPAAPADRDGCMRSVATVDVSNLTLDLFRTAAGSTATHNTVAVRGSSTIDAARFTIENPKRFEVLGRCGTTGKTLRMTLNRTWDGSWSGSGGF